VWSVPSSEPFQPDFFNNVAAIAIVLTFAKVVSHRSRDHRPCNGESGGWRTFCYFTGAPGVGSSSPASFSPVKSFTTTFQR
jgi:hypothetical protein